LQGSSETQTKNMFLLVFKWNGLLKLLWKEIMAKNQLNHGILLL